MATPEIPIFHPFFPKIFPASSPNGPETAPTIRF